MRRHRIWYGAAVLAALIIYIISNRSEALTIFLCLLLVPLFSLAVQQAALRGFHIRCMMRPSCHVKQKVPLEISIRRNNRLPLGRLQLKVLVENAMYGEAKEQEVILCASEKKTMQFRHYVEMENCGCVRVTVLYVKCYDLLGLFCWKKPGSAIQEALVYPAELQLNIQLSRRPETIISGELYDQNRKGQDVSEVSGLRDYEKGDSLGSIHWKLSSKLDDLIVREFGYPSNYSVLILYDLMTEFGDKKISNECNDAVMALTVAVSYSMVERNLEHNVGCMTGTDMQNFPVYSLATHEQMVVNLLCRPSLRKESSGDSIYHFLQQDFRERYTKIIYITPEYEESSVRQLSKELDMTIIQVSQGDGKEYITAQGYSVIPVDADTYQKKAHNIVI